MKIDSDKIWMMPLIIEPVAPERQNRVGSVYGKVDCEYASSSMCAGVVI